MYVREMKSNYLKTYFENENKKQIECNLQIFYSSIWN
jgi:hypothetical protein